MSTFDYIVIGAGSAGCVLAHRLSEDGKHTVLLLEAGGLDRHVSLKMPAAFSIPVNDSRFNWLYMSEPESGLGNRRIHCPRGRVLGGSSSINGMVHVRGHPTNFEQWGAMGATGWGYGDVLPYFKKSEDALWLDTPNDYRGKDGPLKISRGTKRNPLYDDFVLAAEQAGYGLSDDLNGFRQEGFGDLEMTVSQGGRCSASRAYLATANRKPNLTVRLYNLVERLECKGERVTGVHYHDGKRLLVEQANKEVILAAGAIGSPQLLMLSGIGPEDSLRSNAIKPIKVVPAVGQNLMEHAAAAMSAWMPPEARLNDITRRHIHLGWRYSSNMHDAPPGDMFGAVVAKSAWHSVGDCLGSMLSWVNKTYSTGQLTLNSADWRSEPTVEFNMLSDIRDLERLMDCYRRMVGIFTSTAMQKVTRDPFPSAYSERVRKVGTVTTKNKILWFL